MTDLADGENSGLVQHAIRELSFGNVEEDVRPSLIGAVRSYASYGHSGGSHAVCVQILNELLHYRPLGPLTDDPREWIHISEDTAGRPDLWQSVRRPDAFSNNGGRTHYCLDEERRWLRKVLPFRLRRKLPLWIAYPHHRSVRSRRG